MIFALKSRESVTEKQVKEEIKDKNGRVILKINLKFPEIKVKKKDPLMYNAAPFYQRTAENFLFFLKNDFLKLAFDASEKEDFAPYGACMNWKKFYEDERFLSIVLKISLFDGKATVGNEILCQTWEKKFGLKCPFSYFFKKGAKKEIEKTLFKEKNEKISSDLFTLAENGFVFFVSDGKSCAEKFFPHCEQIENISF